MKKLKFIFAFCLSLTILIILINMNRVYIDNLQASTEPMEEIKKNQRILVVAPHCDDEVLGCGGVIYKALQRGDQVKVVMMTNGDGFLTAANLNFPLVFSEVKKFLDLGELRQEETIKGLGSLGLPEKDIIFLSYPDGGLDKLWSLHWDKTKPYLNPHDLSDHSPYLRTYQMKALYTGENVVANLREIIKEYRPTTIFYPHPNDVHPDHWATNSFIKYVLTTQGLNSIPQNLYLVHRGLWPMNLALGERQELVPPTPLANNGTEWGVVPLNHKEIKQKKEAILQYRTQVKVMEPFLLAFIRSNELFGFYPDATLSKGELALLIPDPVGDFENDRIFKGADIAGLYGRIKDGNLEIQLRTVSRLLSNIDYSIRLRLLNSKAEVARIDLTVDDGKVLLQNNSKTSIREIKNLKVKAINDQLSVSIPLASLPQFEYIYLSGESQKDNVLVDKTAWKMLLPI